jgi:hypothetical protein
VKVAGPARAQGMPHRLPVTSDPHLLWPTRYDKGPGSMTSHLPYLLVVSHTPSKWKKKVRRQVTHCQLGGQSSEQEWIINLTAPHISSESNDALQLEKKVRLIHHQQRRIRIFSCLSNAASRRIRTRSMAERGIYPRIWLID